MKSVNNIYYTKDYESILSKSHLLSVFIAIISYIQGLQEDQSEVIQEANILFQSLEIRDENVIEESIECCHYFLIDSLTHILMKHYDPLWLFMNSQDININKQPVNQNYQYKFESKNHFQPKGVFVPQLLWAGF